MKDKFGLRDFPGFRWIGIFFFVFLYLPVVVLFVLSFNANRTATVWEGFSLKWYAALLQNTQILNAARHSLEIAAIATTAALVIAVLAALAMINRWRGMALVSGIINLPLIVPEIVTAVATLLFFAALRQSFGIDLGIGNIAVAHVVFCIPLAFLPIHARLRVMDLTVLEAAADLYATPLQTFRHVTLPLLRPAILSGGILAFVGSLDNVVITSFVSGPGSTTLPIYIFGSIRMGITPEVNAISVVMLLVSITCVSLYLAVGRIGSGGGRG